MADRIQTFAERVATDAAAVLHVMHGTAGLTVSQISEATDLYAGRVRLALAYLLGSDEVSDAGESEDLARVYVSDECEGAA